MTTRRIHVEPVIVSISPSLVLWSERMGHSINDELVGKALRQYLKILEATRAYKRRRRSTPEGREHLNRLSRESRVRMLREREGA